MRNPGSTSALSTTIGGALVAAGLLLAAPAGAAVEVIVVAIDPPTKTVCMEAVDELRSRSKGVAGTALVAAHADEAAEACNAGDYAEAEEALGDGYRWLSKKQRRGL